MTYTEAFCMKLGEYINIDSFGTEALGRYSTKRLVSLNISNMNLGDAIICLAEPIKTAITLASV